MATLVKSKKQIMETLSFMFDSYNVHRETLKYDHEKARDKVLENYDDFYNWLVNK